MIYNFHEVVPGLFRSGQPCSRDEWRWAYDVCGIRKELKLNDPTQGDYTSPQVLGIETHNIWIPDGVPVVENPAQFDWVDFLIDTHATKETPLLVHCYGGKDRTGLAIARFRVRRCGWSKERAYEEWIAYGSNRYAGVEKLWREWSPC